MMDWKQAAEAHARAEYPREACGLVVLHKGRARYRPCTNVADSGDHFVIAPQELAAVEDAADVIGVFHSHPNDTPQPSDRDCVQCEHSGLPWHVIGLPSGEWCTIEPSRAVPPLIGRCFEHGKVDCYTLIRDWYLVEHGVVLPDFARADEWWAKGENLYTEGYPLAGFRPVAAGELSHGDVILMKIHSPVPNHAAVYVGQDTILHHLYGRLSCREPYGALYRHATTHVLRYAPA